MLTGRSRFGDLERAALEVLWGPEGSPRPGLGWMTVRDVHDQLSHDRAIAYTTAMTVLDRMARKGVLLRRKEGRAHHYRPRHSRSEMTVEVMRDALEEFSEADRRTALVAFVGEVGQDEREALRAALAALEEQDRT